MGQRKKDREWPSPRNTRHVWVLAGRFTPPVQGLVIGWRRHSYAWSALTALVDESVPGGRLVVERIPGDRLRPVRTDPNEAIRYADFTELLRPPR